MRRAGLSQHLMALCTSGPPANGAGARRRKRAHDSEQASAIASANKRGRARSVRVRRNKRARVRACARLGARCTHHAERASAQPLRARASALQSELNCTSVWPGPIAYAHLAQEGPTTELDFSHNSLAERNRFDSR